MYCKDEFSASVSHDPSEITLISNQCWKQLPNTWTQWSCFFKILQWI